MWWGAKGHMRKITSDWLPLLMVGLCLSNSYIRRLKNHIIRPLASKRSMTAIREAFQQNVRSINLATVANDFTQEKLDTLRTTEREASDSGHLSKHELPWAAIPFADIGSNNHCDRGDSDPSECEFPIHQQSATSATIQNELYPGESREEQETGRRKPLHCTDCMPNDPFETSGEGRAKYCKLKTKVPGTTQLQSPRTKDWRRSCDLDEV
ncbi:hypothetical protein AXG93_3789s1070 [Marchantia polymorpha subsp. ruderalis]|uniref:Uncharacterized protein n=1 Tax=Marchantia polymorpha subsp. ruderalis TaxID=1480154 RepID=A0A176WE19_MARPO|nr:hypothetical protein AXG93_3789s1070 [Marchantia polymorpha subsp. ruderalis]